MCELFHCEDFTVCSFVIINKILSIVSLYYHKHCRDNMDHCLMGVKQQPTCFPNSTPPEYYNTLQKQQYTGDIWNIHASDFLNPLYEVINQDIKWITKLKWKRNLKVNNSQRTLKQFLPRNSHYSSHTLSYLLSTKNPVFSRRRSKMPRKLFLVKVWNF